MHLKKLAIPLLFSLFFIFAPKVFAYTVVDGDIIENTTWTQDQSPYVVSYPIVVVTGVVLDINPGVIVKFDDGASLLVDGTLNAKGINTEPIYFTSLADDSIGGDTNGDGGGSSPFAGDWENITIENPTTQSTLNHLILRYSYEGLVLLSDGSVISDTLDSDQGIFAMGSHSSFTDLTVPTIHILDGSAFSINGATILTPDDYYDSSIYVYNESALTLKNATIESNNFSDIALIFNDSSANFDSVNITGDTLYSDGVSIFNNSSLNLNKSSITVTGNGLRVSANSSAVVTNSSVVCHGEGISVHDNGTLNFSKGSVSCDSDGMLLFNEAKAIIDDVKIANAADIGILAFDNYGPNPITLTKSEITGNEYSFIARDTAISVHQNNIHNNVAGAMVLNPLTPNQFDFTSNYWGDPSGPRHSSNPGGLGDIVSDDVLFNPWLTSDPLGTCTENCFSNILFFPGIMGSRLYKTEGISDNELWVSSDDSNHADLALDNQGKSIDSTVHTKNDTQKLDGDGGETGIVDDVYNFNMYKSFITDLHKWKDVDHIIADYDFIPYDWRLSLNDIITNGSASPDGNLSYNQTQDFSQSFILKKLNALQKNSKSKKVTIVAHSNGGLVAKALIQKLKDTNNPLYDKIDKVILVAVPQVGTPDGFINLLHGSEVGPFGLIMKTARSRQLSENMQSVYNLFPSVAYFTAVSTIPSADVVSFEDKQFFNPQISKYGLYISNETELKDYILGGDGRIKPDFEDTVHPNIGNSNLYTQAETVHQMLDNWQPSVGTKVIQVAGWGEETNAGLDYKTYVDLWGNEKLSYKPRKVIDGDGTVVVPSALWMSDTDPNVERWWVDLPKYNGQVIKPRDHRDILEISNLLNFVKSKIKDENFVDLDNIVVNNTSTLISNDERLHYTLHSPLTLGIADTEGRYTGQDPITKEIKEEIPNVTYEKIGDVQFISTPAGVVYILSMHGYEIGDFSLDIDKQDGNSIMNSVSFQGIPSSVSTVATVNIPVDFNVTNSALNLDQNGDGIVDKTLFSSPGGTTIYNTIPPELKMVFDTNRKNVVFSAQDDSDQYATLLNAKGSITLEDNSSNTTSVLLSNTRDILTRTKLSFDRIIRNGVITLLPNTNIIYEWKESRGVMTDLNIKITINGVEKYVFSYNKEKDVTIVKENINGRIVVTTKPGFVTVTAKTEGSGLRVDY